MAKNLLLSWTSTGFYFNFNLFPSTSVVYLNNWIYVRIPHYSRGWQQGDYPFKSCSEISTTHTMNDNINESLHYGSNFFPLCILRMKWTDCVCYVKMQNCMKLCNSCHVVKWQLLQPSHISSHIDFVCITVGQILSGLHCGHVLCWRTENCYFCIIASSRLYLLCIQLIFWKK